MLLREYAIQPEVLKDPALLRFVLCQTGVSQGRLISKFPNRWIRMVYDACIGSEIDEAKLEVLGKKLKSRVVSEDRPYIGSNCTWVQNALNEHSRKPFKGVIVEDKDKSLRTETVVGASDIDDECACWQVSRDTVVRRVANDLCRPAAFLLRMSREVVFVDRYFEGSVKHGRPLSAFLTEALAGKNPSRVEYHIDNRASADYIISQLRKMLKFIPPLGDTSLRFVRWRQIPEQDGLHPRYILTERGGMKFDWGLAEDDGKTTDVHLLDTEIYTRRWAEYCAESTAFQFADGFEILHGRLYSIAQEHGKFRNTGPV